MASAKREELLELERFLAAAGLQPAAAARALAVLQAEDIDSVELLRRCWHEVAGKLSVGAAGLLAAALGVSRASPEITEAMETSADAGSSSAAASSVVVLAIEVVFGSQLQAVRLSLSPEEHVSLPVSDLLRRVAVQAYDCFRQHVVIESLELGGGRLDLGSSLAAQGIGHGATLHATAAVGNPVHQRAVRGAQLKPEGVAAGSPAHAARVAEVVQREEQPLNPSRHFKCHGDCLPGIHCILQAQSTAAVSLVPGYLAGSGVQILSNGYWYEVAGTALSIDPPCAGMLQSASEREYGMCDACKGIRSSNVIAQRLHRQREQGRGAETDALTLLQTVRTPAHVNAAFHSFFTLIKERRVLLREVDANRAALELLWERQQAREGALLERLHSSNSALATAKGAASELRAAVRALRKAHTRQGGQLDRTRKQVHLPHLESALASPPSSPPDAEARTWEFKRHTIISFPFTGSGAEVGRIRQVAYRTNAGFDYINGVPAGLERDVRIYCDWFVVDATASAAWRAAHDAAEDARLAALPGAQRVEQVLEDAACGRGRRGVSRSLAWL